MLLGLCSRTSTFLPESHSASRQWRLVKKFVGMNFCGGSKVGEKWEWPLVSKTLPVQSLLQWFHLPLSSETQAHCSVQRWDLGGDWVFAGAVASVKGL